MKTFSKLSDKKKTAFVIRLLKKFDNLSGEKCVCENPLKTLRFGLRLLRMYIPFANDPLRLFAIMCHIENAIEEKAATEKEDMRGQKIINLNEYRSK
jgi:hypothetical protein